MQLDKKEGQDNEIEFFLQESLVLSEKCISEHQIRYIISKLFVF